LMKSTMMAAFWSEVATFVTGLVVSLACWNKLFSYRGTPYMISVVLKHHAGWDERDRVVKSELVWGVKYLGFVMVLLAAFKSHNPIITNNTVPNRKLYVIVLQIVIRNLVAVIV
jgi:hypothetical protein